MLLRTNLHNYQVECIQHNIEHKDSMLWLGLGLGKTIISLTTIIDLMNKGEIKKTLVFGPLRVITSVWDQEASDWEHTRKLRFSIINGSREERERAVFASADVYLCNYENMSWLAEILDRHYISKGKPLPFEMVVYDEVSKLKSSTSQRMKGGRRDVLDSFGAEYEVKIMGWKTIIPHFKRRIGLTGTPASNGYIDLHGQYLAVDGGDRLGKTITGYRENFFTRGRNGWGYEPTTLGIQTIENRISDITKNMNAKDYLDLPDVKYNDVYVELPPKARRAYDQVEEDMFTKLESGEEIEVFNTASVYNKCIQFANGFPYTNKPDEPQKWETLHDAKLQALDSILEEAAGQPVLCSYSFKSDAEAIMNKFKKYRPVNLSEENASKTGDIIKKWNQGKIKLLVGHPASMGHGVNGLQKSGSIVVWFGLNWSLELYLQMNGRIDRQGQTQIVTIHRILCKHTLDMAVADALDMKNDTQEGLKHSIDKYKNGYILPGKVSFL